MAVNEYRQAKLLLQIFPELPETAGEEMEGELECGQESRNWHARNGVGPSGPAESQLYREDDSRE
jgi:hypothetical protein